MIQKSPENKAIGGSPADMTVEVLIICPHIDGVGECGQSVAISRALAEKLVRHGSVKIIVKTQKEE